MARPLWLLEFVLKGSGETRFLQENGFLARLLKQPLMQAGSSADSDWDFVVEFDTPSPQEAFDRFFGLLEALEDEFKVKIDLLEARAVKNPYLRKTIERDRVRLYG